MNNDVTLDDGDDVATQPGTNPGAGAADNATTLRTTRAMAREEARVLASAAVQAAGSDTELRDVVDKLASLVNESTLTASDFVASESVAAQHAKMTQLRATLAREHAEADAERNAAEISQLQHELEVVRATRRAVASVTANSNASRQHVLVTDPSLVSARQHVLVTDPSLVSARSLSTTSPDATVVHMDADWLVSPIASRQPTLVTGGRQASLLSSGAKPPKAISDAVAKRVINRAADVAAVARQLRNYPSAQLRLQVERSLSTLSMTLQSVDLGVQVRGLIVEGFAQGVEYSTTAVALAGLLTTVDESDHKGMMRMVRQAMGLLPVLSFELAAQLLADEAFNLTLPWNDQIDQLVALISHASDAPSQEFSWAAAIALVKQSLLACAPGDTRVYTLLFELDSPPTVAPGEILRRQQLFAKINGASAHLYFASVRRAGGGSSSSSNSNARRVIVSKRPRDSTTVAATATQFLGTCFNCQERGHKKDTCTKARVARAPYGDGKPKRPPTTVAAVVATPVPKTSVDDDDIATETDYEVVSAADTGRETVVDAFVAAHVVIDRDNRAPAVAAVARAREVKSDAFAQHSKVPLFIDVCLRASEKLIRSTACIDTGAGASVVSIEFANDIGAKIGDAPAHRIVGVGGSAVKVVGATVLEVMIGGAAMKVNALVLAKAVFPLLISLTDLRKTQRAEIEIVNGTSRVRVNDGAWTTARSSVASHVPIGVAIVDDVVATSDNDDDHDVFVATLAGIAHVRVALVDRLSMPAVEYVVAFAHAQAEMVGEQAAALERVAAEELASGKPYTLPSLVAGDSAMPAGPATSGSDVNAYEQVVISDDISPAMRQKLRLLLERNKAVFGGTKGIGATKTPPVNCAGIVAKLTLYPNATLDDVVAHSGRTSPEQTRVLREHRLTFEAEHRLVPSPNPPVLSRAFVVTNSDGKSRVVVDFKNLNKQILTDCTPLPRLTDLHAWLACGVFRSSFDLWSAFYQIPLDKNSVPLTAALYDDGIVRASTVLPMGVSMAPGFMQDVAERVFNNEHTRAYIDDICQVGDTEDDVYANVEHVLQCCARNGLTLGAAKCKIGYRELLMLGKLIGNNTIAAHPRQMEAVRKYGKPRTVRQLRVWLGMIAALASHLVNIAAVLRPLHAAVGAAKRGPLTWSPEMTRAFDDGKRVLQSPEIVVPYDETRALYLLSDWSKLGKCVVLAHLAPSNTHFEIVEVLSQANTKAESNYSAVDGEIVNIRLALKAFGHILRRGKFYWVIDSKIAQQSLASLRTSTSARMQRTRFELNGIHVVVLHCPGKMNIIADALSRDPAWCVDDKQQRVDEKALDDRGVKSDVDDGFDDESPRVAAALLARTVAQSTWLLELAARQRDDVELEPLMAAAKSFAAGERRATDARAVVLRERSIVSSSNSAASDVIDSTADDDDDDDGDDEVDDGTRTPTYDSDDVDDGALTPTYDIDDDVDDKTQRKRAPSSVAFVGALTQLAIDKLKPRRDDDDIVWVVGDDDVWRVAVPKGMRTRVMHAAHDGATGAAHWSAQRTLESLRRSYWWPTIFGDVTQFARACTACARVNLQRQLGNNGNNEQREPAGRLEAVEVDVVELDNELFVGTLDRYSGFVTLTRVASKSSASLASALEMYIMNRGPPKYVFSDNGTEFMGAFAELCVSRNIQQVKNAPYEKGGSARVERLFRTLRASVAKQTALESKGAPRATMTTKVMRAAYEINVAVDKNGMSPFLLMYAKQPPMHALLDRVSVATAATSAARDNNGARDVSTLAREHAALQEARDVRQLANYERNKASHERRRAPPRAYEQGDRVWAAMPREAQSLKKDVKALAWFGPFLVVEHQLDRDLVELHYEAGAASFTFTAHARQTRPYAAQAPDDAPELTLVNDDDDGVPLPGLASVPAEFAAKMRAAEAAVRANGRRHASKTTATARGGSGTSARGESNADKNADSAIAQRIAQAPTAARDQDETERAAQHEPVAIERIEETEAGERALVVLRNGERRFLTTTDLFCGSEQKQNLLRTFREEDRAAQARRTFSSTSRVEL